MPKEPVLPEGNQIEIVAVRTMVSLSTDNTKSGAEESILKSTDLDLRSEAARLSASDKRYLLKTFDNWQARPNAKSALGTYRSLFAALTMALYGGVALFIATLSTDMPVVASTILYVVSVGLFLVPITVASFVLKGGTLE